MVAAETIPWVNGAERLECAKCKACKAAAFKKNVVSQVPSVSLRPRRGGQGGGGAQDTELQQLRKQLQSVQEQLQQEKKRKASTMDVDEKHEEATDPQKERLADIDGLLDSIKEKDAILASLRAKQPITVQLSGLNDKLARTKTNIQKVEKLVEAKRAQLAEIQASINRECAQIEQLRQQEIEVERKIREVGMATSQPPKRPGEPSQLGEAKVELTDLQDMVRSAGGGALAETLPQLLHTKLTEMVSAKRARLAEGNGADPGRLSEGGAPESTKPIEEVKSYLTAAGHELPENEDEVRRAEPFVPRSLMGDNDVDPFAFDDYHGSGFQDWGADDEAGPHVPDQGARSGGDGPVATAGLAATDGIVADNRVHGQVAAADACGPSPAQRPRAETARPSLAATRSARGAASAEKRDEVRGYFPTVNATSHGPLCDYLGGKPGHAVLGVQERHATTDNFDRVQSRLHDLGYHGMWAPAIATGKGNGTSAGVAVSAKSHISLTCPPATSTPVLEAGHGPASDEALSTMLQYIHMLTSLCMDWVALGDSNMTVEELGLSWIHALLGVAIATTAATCRQGDGSIIDYALVAANLATKVGMPEVDEEALTSPHRPVVYPLRTVEVPMWCRAPDEPSPIGAVPPTGRARPPRGWERVHELIQIASSQADLQVAWDAVLMETENELLDRWDVTGRERLRRSGRGGVVRTKWVARQWKPPAVRLQQGDAARAWGAAARWAQHLTASRKQMQTKIQRLQAANALCALSPTQFEDIVAFFIELQAFFQRVMRKPYTLKRLPDWVVTCFSHGPKVFNLEDFEPQALAIQDADKIHLQQDQSVRNGKWKGWAHQAFIGSGTGQAHRATKCRALQEVIGAAVVGEPHVLVERELTAWKEVWSCRELDPLTLPTVSDAGPTAIADLFNKCEENLTWPDERTINELVRLPKGDGNGHRLIALVQTLVRLWPKARSPLSKAWLKQANIPDIWGCGGPGRSSSHVAFARILEAEQKYETSEWFSVIPRALVDDLTLQWVGANTKTLHFLFGAVKKFIVLARPLGLILQVEKSGLVAACPKAKRMVSKQASPIGIPLKSRTRNLGHELHGTDRRRHQTKARMAKLKKRMVRVKASRWTVGNKVSVIWRSGLLSSANHCATVSGTPDKDLQTLRRAAGALCGAKEGSTGLTAYPMTQKDPWYDPIYDATLSPVVAYSQAIWGATVALGRLERVFEVQFELGPG
ncbi:unnamed protein product [Prorocentrum cordatum]|uniref:Uncharacterized protein n=1 Tax=Prorocentrum cordatum TaxID=2364126 RepID=A0ABN9TX06_9DINO|nr:unnamed protein product [Polarella glacialis]